jgi:hypothetical protein
MTDLVRSNATVISNELSKITKSKIKNQNARAAVDSVMSCIGGMVSSDNIVFIKMSEDKDFYLECRLLPDKEIHLSNLEQIIRNGAGFVKDIELDVSDSRCIPVIRIMFRDDHVGTFEMDKYEPTWTVVRKCIIDRAKLPQVELLADFLNIKTLIEAVFHMRKVMPILDFNCIIDKKTQRYVIEIIGIDRMTKSFINYLASELGNTFLETVVTSIDVLNTNKIFNVKFHVRMSTRAPKYVFSEIGETIQKSNTNGGEDESDDEECAQTLSVWKRNVREIGEITDESEAEGKRLRRSNWILATT